MINNLAHYQQQSRLHLIGSWRQHHAPERIIRAAAASSRLPTTVAAAATLRSVTQDVHVDEDEDAPATHSVVSTRSASNVCRAQVPYSVPDVSRGTLADADDDAGDVYVGGGVFVLRQQSQRLLTAFESTAASAASTSTDDAATDCRAGGDAGSSSSSSSSSSINTVGPPLRVFLHFDMDAFFCCVAMASREEAITLEDEKKWKRGLQPRHAATATTTTTTTSGSAPAAEILAFRSQPIVVAGGSGTHSDVSSCNYVARSMGVRAGMWVGSAREALQAYNMNHKKEEGGNEQHPQKHAKNMRNEKLPKPPLLSPPPPPSLVVIPHDLPRCVRTAEQVYGILLRELPTTVQLLETTNAEASPTNTTTTTTFTTTRSVNKQSCCPVLDADPCRYPHPEALLQKDRRAMEVEEDAEELDLFTPRQVTPQAQTPPPPPSPRPIQSTITSTITPSVLVGDVDSGGSTNPAACATSSPASSSLLSVWPLCVDIAPVSIDDTMVVIGIHPAALYGNGNGGKHDSRNQYARSKDGIDGGKALQLQAALFEAAAAYAARVRKAVLCECAGCSVSCGIGPTPLVARAASEKAKPNGTFVVGGGGGVSVGGGGAGGGFGEEDADDRVASDRSAPGTNGTRACDTRTGALAGDTAASASLLLAPGKTIYYRSHHDNQSTRRGSWPSDRHQHANDVSRAFIGDLPATALIGVGRRTHERLQLALQRYLSLSPEGGSIRGEDPRGGNGWWSSSRDGRVVPHGATTTTSTTATDVTRPAGTDRSGGGTAVTAPRLSVVSSAAAPAAVAPLPGTTTAVGSGLRQMCFGASNPSSTGSRRIGGGGMTLVRQSTREDEEKRVIQAIGLLCRALDEVCGGDPQREESLNLKRALAGNSALKNDAAAWSDDEGSSHDSGDDKTQVPGAAAGTTVMSCRDLRALPLDLLVAAASSSSCNPAATGRGFGGSETTTATTTAGGTSRGGEYGPMLHATSSRKEKKALHKLLISATDNSPVSSGIAAATDRWHKIATRLLPHFKSVATAAAAKSGTSASSRVACAKGRRPVGFALYCHCRGVDTRGIDGILGELFPTTTTITTAIAHTRTSDQILLPSNAIAQHPERMVQRPSPTTAAVAVGVFHRKTPCADDKHKDVLSDRLNRIRISACTDTAHDSVLRLLQRALVWFAHIAGIGSEAYTTLHWLFTAQHAAMMVRRLGGMLLQQRSKTTSMAGKKGSGRGGIAQKKFAKLENDTDEDDAKDAVTEVSDVPELGGRMLDYVEVRSKKMWWKQRLREACATLIVHTHVFSSAALDGGGDCGGAAGDAPTSNTRMNNEGDDGGSDDKAAGTGAGTAGGSLLFLPFISPLSVRAPTTTTTPSTTTRKHPPPPPPHRVVSGGGTAAAPSSHQIPVHPSSAPATATAPPPPRALPPPSSLPRLHVASAMQYACRPFDRPSTAHNWAQLVADIVAKILKIRRRNNNNNNSSRQHQLRHHHNLFLTPDEAWQRRLAFIAALQMPSSPFNIASLHDPLHALWIGQHTPVVLRGCYSIRRPDAPLQPAKPLGLGHTYPLTVVVHVRVTGAFLDACSLKRHCSGDDGGSSCSFLPPFSKPSSASKPSSWCLCRVLSVEDLLPVGTERKDDTKNYHDREEDREDGVGEADSCSGGEGDDDEKVNDVAPPLPSSKYSTTASPPVEIVRTVVVLLDVAQTVVRSPADVVVRHAYVPHAPPAAAPQTMAESNLSTHRVLTYADIRACCCCESKVEHSHADERAMMPPPPQQPLLQAPMIGALAEAMTMATDGLVQWEEGDEERKMGAIKGVTPSHHAPMMDRLAPLASGGPPPPVSDIRGMHLAASGLRLEPLRLLKEEEEEEEEVRGRTSRATTANTMATNTRAPSAAVTATSLREGNAAKESMLTAGMASVLVDPFQVLAAREEEEEEEDDDGREECDENGAGAFRPGVFGRREQKDEKAAKNNNAANTTTSTSIQKKEEDGVSGGVRYSRPRGGGGGGFLRAGTKRDRQGDAVVEADGGGGGGESAVVNLLDDDDDESGLDKPLPPPPPPASVCCKSSSISSDNDDDAPLFDHANRRASHNTNNNNKDNKSIQKRRQQRPVIHLVEMDDQEGEEEEETAEMTIRRPGGPRLLPAAHHQRHVKRPRSTTPPPPPAHPPHLPHPPHPPHPPPFLTSLASASATSVQAGIPVPVVEQPVVVVVLSLESEPTPPPPPPNPFQVPPPVVVVVGEDDEEKEDEVEEDGKKKAALLRPAMRHRPTSTRAATDVTTAGATAGAATTIETALPLVQCSGDSICRNACSSSSSCRRIMTPATTTTTTAAAYSHDAVINKKEVRRVRASRWFCGQVDALADALLLQIQIQAQITPPTPIPTTSVTTDRDRRDDDDSSTTTAAQSKHHQSGDGGGALNPNATRAFFDYSTLSASHPTQPPQPSQLWHVLQSLRALSAAAVATRESLVIASRLPAAEGECEEVMALSPPPPRLIVQQQEEQRQHRRRPSSTQEQHQLPVSAPPPPAPLAPQERCCERCVDNTILLACEAAARRLLLHVGHVLPPPSRHEEGRGWRGGVGEKGEAMPPSSLSLSSSSSSQQQEQHQLLHHQQERRRLLLLYHMQAIARYWDLVVSVQQLQQHSHHPTRLLFPPPPAAPAPAATPRCEDERRLYLTRCFASLVETYFGPGHPPRE